MSAGTGLRPPASPTQVGSSPRGVWGVWGHATSPPLLEFNGNTKSHPGEPTFCTRLVMLGSLLSDLHQRVYSVLAARNGYLLTRGCHTGR